MISHTTMCSRVSVTLFALLLSATAFAQVSSVPDRATLAGTDFIDWQSLDDGNLDGQTAFTFLSSPADILSNGNVAVTVAQQLNIWSLIVQEPNWPWTATNLPDGDYLYYTNIDSNLLNPISFSDFDGLGVCGFGTQIAPSSTGAFTARIEAFDALDASMGHFDVIANSSDPDAAFLGISSTDPMSRVEVSIQGEATGLSAGVYAINQVDFKACSQEPEVPALSCEGFAAPMANHPVLAKKNRVLPLRMELFDDGGFEQTDVELTALPVVTVLFTSSSGGDSFDVSGETLPAGHASEGNQFTYTDDGFWQFNLRPKNNYTASGTYLVTVDSGDESEYVIDPSCVTSFIID